jgi:hypothetical protein
MALIDVFILGTKRTHSTVTLVSDKKGGMKREIL